MADNLTLNVNYRFAPGKDEAAVRQRLGEIIGDEATWAFRVDDSRR